MYLCISQSKYPRCCNSDALHELNPKLAGWQVAQKPYENHFLFQKECSLPYDFCREADNVGWTNCACIIYARTIIFCTHKQILIIIYNIKKVLNNSKLFSIMDCIRIKSILLLFCVVFVFFNKLK